MISDKVFRELDKCGCLVKWIENVRIQREGFAKYIDYLDRCYPKNTKTSEILTGSFEWGKTPEGAGFWINIHGKLLENE